MMIIENGQIVFSIENGRANVLDGRPLDIPDDPRWPEAPASDISDADRDTPEHIREANS